MCYQRKRNSGMIEVFNNFHMTPICDRENIFKNVIHNLFKALQKIMCTHLHFTKPFIKSISFNMSKYIRILCYVEVVKH